MHGWQLKNFNGGVSHMVTDISSDELKHYLNNRKEGDYLLIDVREPKEYAVFHIPGALLIPLKDVELKIVGFDTVNKDLIFYCRSGRRSRIAAEFVDSMGMQFNKIFNLAGGILAWQGKSLAGFPRFMTINPVGGAEQVLKDAIGFEKAAERFYETVAQEFSASVVSDMALHLARFEIGHAKVIYALLKHMNPAVPSFETMYEAASDSFLEGGLMLNEALDRLKAMEGEPILNFAEIAVEIEWMAYELYKNYAAITNDIDVARVFLQLAEQEKGHARIIAHYF